jgi:hypothetical protein
MSGFGCVNQALSVNVGFDARQYNHAGCMKLDSFRKQGVVSRQYNRALSLRRASPQDHAAIQKCMRAGLDGQPAPGQVAETLRRKVDK